MIELFMLRTRTPTTYQEVLRRSWKIACRVPTAILGAEAFAESTPFTSSPSSARSRLGLGYPYTWLALFPTCHPLRYSKATFFNRPRSYFILFHFIPILTLTETFLFPSFHFPGEFFFLQEFDGYFLLLLDL